MLSFSVFRSIVEKEESDSDSSDVKQKGVSVRGIHYSHKPGLHELHGEMFGSGIKGAEHARLSETKDPRIKKRSYFYNAHDDKLPKIFESGLGQHTHSAHLHKIYDPQKASDEERAEVTAHKEKHLQRGEHNSNAFESAVLDAKYHGYTNGDVTIALGHKAVPVKYEGIRHEIKSKETT